MRKATSASIIAFLILIAPSSIEAQVINEVLYSPSTKQWVEIYNGTDSAIDLSQYKILDAGAATNGHSISASQAGGSTSLPAREFGVIAKDPTSVNAAYAFKASLGIKATGDTLTLKKGASVIDTMAFSDTADAGNSLQKFDANWAQSPPTPGTMNVLVQSGSGGGDGGAPATTTDATTTQPAISDAPPVSYSAHYSFVPAQNDTSVKFSASAGRERLGVVGQELVFKAVSNTSDPNASYIWNFGDGATAQGRETSHAYALPGDYIVVLNAVLFDNEAVSRTRAKIVEPDLAVENAAEYTAVRNRAKYEINLYGWELTDGTHMFPFPKDTLIGAGETVKFPSAVTKLGLGAVLARGTSQMPTPPGPRSSREDARSSSAVDPEAVQALADKLVALNLELFNMNNPDPARQGSIASDEPASQAAAAIEAPVMAPSAPRGWLSTLKRFFLR